MHNVNSQAIHYLRPEAREGASPSRCKERSELPENGLASIAAGRDGSLRPGSLRSIRLTDDSEDGDDRSTETERVSERDRELSELDRLERSLGAVDGTRCTGDDSTGIGPGDEELRGRDDCASSARLVRGRSSLTAAGWVVSTVSRRLTAVSRRSL